MENITFGQFAGGLAALVGVCGALAYFLKPVTSLMIRVKKIEDHQDKDLKRLERIDNDLREILMSVNALLSHNIDGNHTEQLKQRKNELSDYLINHRG